MHFFLLFFLLPFLLFGELFPRKVIGFYDSRTKGTVEDSMVHLTLELPLNHLGFDVEYYDIQKDLPDLSNRNDVRGILVCFKDGVTMPNPAGFIEWASRAIDQGKKVVILRNPGFASDNQGNFTPPSIQNRLFKKLGFINDQKSWVERPHNYKILALEKEIAPFELRYPDLLPGFDFIRVIDPSAKAYLTVGVPEHPETASELIVIHPNGAYISPYYANSWDLLLYVENPRALGWYVNPYLFFELVFNLKHHPIPDTTTLAGRRIYFSTIHGDDWNAKTSIDEYKQKETYVSEVLLDKVIIPNPDLPVTVAVVAADADLDWVGTLKSQQIVRKYFQLPQVEAASHTYSHPLDWQFFRTGGPEKEIKYLYRYPYGSWQNSFLSWFNAKEFQFFTPKKAEERELKRGYVIPRTYANFPFDINKEISGAFEFLNQFAPNFNKPKVLIWSGDSLPWGEVLTLAHNIDVYNYGGGSVRLDPDHPSILFVYPLGRKPGGYIQLYSAADGENDYTGEWQERFYGFQYLPETLKNTESPRRLKPILLYYHSYSGQFQVSLDAVLSNIAFIRAQNIIPITTSRYCTIGEGFYSAEIEPVSDSVWKIRNRKGLQTLRFDHAENITVDFTRSSGVIGYNHHEGSLYTYLDDKVTEPVVAIREGGVPENSFLIESSWELGNLRRDSSKIKFEAKGWGKLVMKWQMLEGGTYTITAHDTLLKNFEQQHTYQFNTDEKKVLTVEMELPYNRLRTVTIEKAAL